MYNTFNMYGSWKETENEGTICMWFCPSHPHYVIADVYSMCITSMWIAVVFKSLVVSLPPLVRKYKKSSRISTSQGCATVETEHETKFVLYMSEERGPWEQGAISRYEKGARLVMRGKYCLQETAWRSDLSSLLPPANLPVLFHLGKALVSCFTL